MITNKRALELAKAGERGKDWYAQAGDQLQRFADRQGYDKRTVCEVLALTSPRVAVKRNLRVAFKYLAGHDDWSDGIVRTVRQSVANWENGQGIKGKKTSAFCANLDGCTDSICLDSWMAKAFCVDKGKVNQVKIGKPIKTMIKRVAKVLGWTNREVQAAIWTAIMAEHGRNDQPYCVEEIEQEIHND
jgi:hypothetical protein